MRTASPRGANTERAKKSDLKAERRLQHKLPQLNLIDKLTQQIANEYRRASAELERLQAGNTGKAETFAAEFIEKSQKWLTEELAHSAPVVKENEELPADGTCWLVSSVTAPMAFTHGQSNYHVLFVHCTNGVATFAAVYQPLNDELHYSIKGTGTVIQRKARVSGRRVLDAAQVVFTPQNLDEAAMALAAKLQSDLSHSGLVITHNPVAEILAVASGQIDAALWQRLSRPFHLFATLALTEAGGKLAKPAGLSDDWLLAAPLPLWEALDKTLA